MHRFGAQTLTERLPVPCTGTGPLLGDVSDPLTGLALVLISGEDWDLNGGEWRAPREWIDDDLLLGAHILGHLVFFGAFTLHIALVLEHQFFDRDGLLSRML